MEKDDDFQFKIPFFEKKTFPAILGRIILTSVLQSLVLVCLWYLAFVFFPPILIGGIFVLFMPIVKMYRDIRKDSNIKNGVYAVSATLVLTILLTPLWAMLLHLN